MPKNCDNCKYDLFRLCGEEDKTPCDDCYNGNPPTKWEPGENYETKTNADRIRAMSDEELADFLCGIAYCRNTPWSEPFATKFCKNCPTVEVTIKETGKTMDFNECDFTDGKCPHGSDTVWWLQQPCEGD